MGQPLFGVSAAGYRLEGGFNGRGEPANQWAPWERTGKVAPGTPQRANLWSDPERVLDLAASAGAEIVALGVEWARIEPSPGVVDEAAVDRYASIFASAAARAITPVGVLHDVAHPGWLGEEFWLTPGSPDRFAEHVARLVLRLGASCRHWVTLRQPNLVALAGWVGGRHPPRRVGALADAWAVVDNLLAAHVLAYAAARDAQPDAEILLGLRASSSYDWQRLMADLLCAPALGVERDRVDEWIDSRRARHDRAVAPRDLADLAWRRLAAATAPFGVNGAITRGRLRRPSPRRAVDVAYRFEADRAAAATGSNGAAPSRRSVYPLDALLVVWCPPRAESVLWPAGVAAPWASLPEPGSLAAWCREQAQLAPGLRVWVEDGFATRRGVARPDGWDRRSYLRAQVAATEGTDVAAYLYYTLQGGGDPTWPDADFGLEPASGAGVPQGADASSDASSDAQTYRRLVAGRRARRDAGADPA